MWYARVPWPHILSPHPLACRAKNAKRASYPVHRGAHTLDAAPYATATGHQTMFSNCAFRDTVYPARDFSCGCHELHGPRKNVVPSPASGRPFRAGRLATSSSFSGARHAFWIKPPLQRYQLRPQTGVFIFQYSSAPRFSNFSSDLLAG